MASEDDGDPNKNVKDKGNGKIFQPRAEPAFKNANAPTPLEIINFDISRSFFIIKKSKTKTSDDIITKASFVNLIENNFTRLIPEIWKKLPKNIHLAYITVEEESVSESNAKQIMEILAHNINLPENSPLMFNGIDIGGQINTKSRMGIESVMYFSGQPKPDDISEIVKKIAKTSEKMSKILDCKIKKTFRSQMQLTNCLGISKQDIIESISSSNFLQVSNLQFKPPNHIASNGNVLTSDNCYLTITHHEQTIFPTTFEAPSMGDYIKTMKVKKIFQYTQQNNLPNPSESNYKTKLCLSPNCTYGEKCRFAHGEKELKVRTTNKSPTLVPPISNKN